MNCRYDVFPRHGWRKAPLGKKVVTVFINFKYKNCNKNQKFVHQNVALVTSYEPINLTQKLGLTICCNRWASGPTLVFCAAVYCRSIQAEWSHHWCLASSAGRRLWQLLWCSDWDETTAHCWCLPATQQLACHWHCSSRFTDSYIDAAIQRSIDGWVVPSIHWPMQSLVLVSVVCSYSVL